MMSNIEEQQQDNAEQHSTSDKLSGEGFLHIFLA